METFYTFSQLCCNYTSLPGSYCLKIKYRQKLRTNFSVKLIIMNVDCEISRRKKKNLNFKGLVYIGNYK